MLGGKWVRPVLGRLLGTPPSAPGYQISQPPVTSLCTSGWLGPVLPRSLGGAGAPHGYLRIVASRFTRSTPKLLATFLRVSIIPPAVVRLGAVDSSRTTVPSPNLVSMGAAYLCGRRLRRRSFVQWC